MTRVQIISQGIGGGMLNSFDFMDETLRRLARKEVVPNLKTIVVAG